MPENEKEDENSPASGRSRIRVRLAKLAIALISVGILAVFLIPTLVRLPEASRLKGCRDNLKQFGLVCKMYANEHEMYADRNRALFPPLSRVPGNFMLAWESVYPDYLDASFIDHPITLACPSDVTGPSELGPETSPNDEGPVWDDKSYVYFSYTIKDVEEGLSFLEIYEQKVTEAIRTGNLAFDEQLGKWLLPESFWEESLYVGKGKGTLNRDHLLRFTENNPGFNYDHTGPPWYPPPSRSIVMFDRPGLAATDFNHAPGGSNLLFMDGHIEFSKYPSDKFIFSPLFIEKFIQTESRIEELY